LACQAGFVISFSPLVETGTSAPFSVARLHSPARGSALLAPGMNRHRIDRAEDATRRNGSTPSATDRTFTKG
jgi:hypothetical protein